MKHLMLGAVIGTTFAILSSALPATAQVVAQEGGLTQVHYYGNRDRDGYRHRWRHRRHYGWRHRNQRYWGYGYAACGVVRVRARLPNGTIVFRTRRVC